MKKLAVLTCGLMLAAASVATAFAQGTVLFVTRNITDAQGNSYSGSFTAGTGADLSQATVQLFLVNGTTYTALNPTATLNATVGQVTGGTSPGEVAIAGAAPNSSAQLAIAAYIGSDIDHASYKSAYSATFTSKPLGGPNPNGPAFASPDLGGLPVNANGQIVDATGSPLTLTATTPEPSTIALGVLGAAALLYRRRK